MLIMYDFGRLVSALQRERNIFGDITTGLTLFGEMPQNVTKKCQKLTQKRIFHVSKF